jgi:hypothetical protein
VGPAAAPAATGVGAYFGALAGALAKLEETPPVTDPYAEAPAPVRRAGGMVAAHAPQTPQRERALDVLLATGAQDIETADGEWRDGIWVDFDPLAPPGAEPEEPLTGPRPQHIRK